MHLSCWTVQGFVFFWNELFEQIGYYHHAKKHTPKNPYYVTWLNWVDKYFVVGTDGIHLREVPVKYVEHRDLLIPRETGRRKPPNPPLSNKCQECREFTKQGFYGVHHQEDLSCMWSFRNNKT